VPASSPSIWFRRPSSWACSSASDSSLTMVSMREFMSATRSARRSSLWTPFPAPRTSQRTTSSKATAAAPAAMATTIVVVTPTTSSSSFVPQLFPVPRPSRSPSGPDLTVIRRGPLDYSFKVINTTIPDATPTTRDPRNDAGFAGLTHRRAIRYHACPVGRGMPLASLCCVVTHFPLEKLQQQCRP